ncbi:hypothetical protein [Planococcus donghaensis]|uniref:hypothetical protein n=1 Tax=Planococcus donghaensis TaxID=414778 RepID=UPI003735452F
MADWEHYINEIQKENTDPERYLVTGTTSDNLICIYTEWSYPVDSEGALVGELDDKLVGSTADHYRNTKLKECINNYLVKQQGRVKLCFQSSEADIVYHATVKGEVSKEE